MQGKDDDDQLRLARRDLLRGAAGLGATALLATVPGAAAMAAEERVKAYGTTTAQLKNWDLMTKSIGVTVDYTPTNSDIGVFMRDVMANDIGDNVDVFFFDGGTQNVLGPQGAYAEIDEKNPELTLWDRTPDAWKRSDLVRFDGKQYGIPVIGNGDCFGYFPEKIGANPNGQDDVSWSVFFEDDRTKGRVAIDRSWLQSLSETANYLNETGKQKIEDVADMPGPVAAKVVDYLVERKKAGQFRTIFTAFEEQVQLLGNKEIDLINCWEPATKEANLKLGPNATIYAFTVEGYYKWLIEATIPVQAAKRANIDTVYKFLNYMLGGEYRAYQAKERGYAGPNMDLGVKYAQDHNWPKEDVELLQYTQTKVDRKYKKPFFCKTTPVHASEMEEEWQRFLNA
ncbi:Spermidine/putrescine-binding protein [Arboricoccus pini]|uniref:Spermidine/putrescine-binding protein n=1 Tax=Arboricoccus pini TaxID=1963835 RepID=A0A212RIZ9_9PROT|nr:extracellular solute-binding protein [Arboricoccus pini]SNB72339.1 Spermidine/putrescine-binding protein [Arboricoccus pini]